MADKKSHLPSSHTSNVAPVPLGEIPKDYFDLLPTYSLLHSKPTTYTLEDKMATPLSFCEGVYVLTNKFQKLLTL